MIKVNNTFLSHREDIKRERAKELVGKGWSGLIDEIYDFKDSLVSDIKITTVKEKFGGLRVYYEVPEEQRAGRISQEFYERLLLVEEKSMTICEVCGEDGELVSIKGWLKTRCPEHEE